MRAWMGQKAVYPSFYRIIHDRDEVSCDVNDTATLPSRVLSSPPGGLASVNRARKQRTVFFETQQDAYDAPNPKRSFIPS